MNNDWIAWPRPPRLDREALTDGANGSLVAEVTASPVCGFHFNIMKYVAAVEVSVSGIQSCAHISGPKIEYFVSELFKYLYTCVCSETKFPIHLLKATDFTAYCRSARVGIPLTLR